MTDETKVRTAEDVRWEIYFAEQAHEKAKEAARLASGLAEKIDRLHEELFAILDKEEGASE